MTIAQEQKLTVASLRLPPWLRQDIPDAGRLREMKGRLALRGINTVCESAHCPNSGQCWQQGIVTVMIMGDVCTRDCKFCAVQKGRPASLDTSEARRIAELVKTLDLRYLVVTSVTRDDLNDGGAQHFAQVVSEIRNLAPGVLIEVLIPDFGGAKQALKTVLAAGPDVVGHNIEMAERLYASIRPQANYQRSLGVLREIKKIRASTVLKSGFMVGLGETGEEVKGLLSDLAEAGCGIVTIGQYLYPGRKHWPVNRFVLPEEFSIYRQWGETAGIPTVISGPLVRSSFMAEAGYLEAISRLLDFKRVKNS